MQAFLNNLWAQASQLKDTVLDLVKQGTLAAARKINRNRGKSFAIYTAATTLLDTYLEGHTPLQVLPQAGIIAAVSVIPAGFFFVASHLAERKLSGQAAANPPQVHQPVIAPVLEAPEVSVPAGKGRGRAKK